MRKFNDKEKEIIKSIYNNYNKSTSGYVLFNIFYNEMLSLGAFYCNGALVVDQTKQNEIRSIEIRIMDVYSLLSFLEINGYILLEDYSIPTSADNIPNFIGAPVVCSISKECKKFIDKSRSNKLFVTTKFKELVSNDFKTYEDIQLEEARKQTNIANESLKEARKQTESASASLAEAQRQTGKAKTQTILSFIAVGLSIFAIIASIIVPRCTPSTLDQKQFDTIQMKQNELIKTLNEIKISKIDNDSLIKELNLANESFDEISNTLKELKKMNSKGK